MTRKLGKVQCSKAILLPSYETITIAGKHHLMTRRKILTDKRNRTGSMTQSPIEWCNQNFHALTITLIPFLRNGAAIASISGAGILDKV